MNDFANETGRPIALFKPSPNPGESIGLIPNVPCVRSNPWRLSALRTNCGMISPKPNVTIAKYRLEGEGWAVRSESAEGSDEPRPEQDEPDGNVNSLCFSGDSNGAEVEAHLLDCPEASQPAVYAPIA